MVKSRRVIENRIKDIGLEVLAERKINCTCHVHMGWYEMQDVKLAELSEDLAILQNIMPFDMALYKLADKYGTRIEV
jgi:hypothetical protein